MPGSTDPSGFTLDPLNAALPMVGALGMWTTMWNFRRCQRSSDLEGNCQRRHSRAQISRVKRDGPKSISLAAAISITLPIATTAEAIEVS